MPDGSFLLIAALVVTPASEFVNGWTDAVNATAAVVSTRALPPSPAVLLAAVPSHTMINVALRTLW